MFFVGRGNESIDNLGPLVGFGRREPGDDLFHKLAQKSLAIGSTGEDLLSVGFELGDDVVGRESVTGSFGGDWTSQAQKRLQEISVSAYVAGVLLVLRRFFVERFEIVHGLDEIGREI